MIERHSIVRCTFINDAIVIYILQSATSPGASNDGLTKQQLELIQQIMQQTQQQQQQQQQQTTAQQQQQQQRTTTSATVTTQIQKPQKPSVKPTISSSSVSSNSGSTSATNSARSSPKPKVWSHVQVSNSSLRILHTIFSSKNLFVTVIIY